MKHTIKLSAVESVQIEDQGGVAVIRFIALGIVAMQRPLEPDTAATIGNALLHAANAAHARQHREAGHV